MKKNTFSIKTAGLLLVALVLLIGSGIGGTRAALNYYSEHYSSQIVMKHIGISLLENGKRVCGNDYDEKGEAVEVETVELLKDMVKEGESFVPGKKYSEVLTAKNSGGIDVFTRVILTKSWQNKEGKETALSPENIELGLTKDWIKGAETKERVVLYYPSVIAPGEETKALMKTIRINNKIADPSHVSQTKTKNEAGDDVITYTYDYDGYRFVLEAEVDAVQTHNAADAIQSAWGVKAKISSDGKSMSLAE